MCTAMLWVSEALARSLKRPSSAKTVIRSPQWGTNGIEGLRALLRNE